MVSECMNPACGRKLVYLRDGRVVRTTRKTTGAAEVEHFWLCGECFHSFDFRFLPDGEVELMARVAPLIQESEGVELPLSA